MDIYGIDFTSSPGRKKPIACLHCRLDGKKLRVHESAVWTAFTDFEDMLKKPGPWIAGIDFPFGLPRRFLNDVKWPLAWRDYVLHAESLGKVRFERALRDYKESQPTGHKQPRRRTDELAGGLSPLKLDYQPVGKMFFQGAPRLVHTGVAIPGLQAGNCERTVVEAYPGVLARTVTKLSYKHDKPNKQVVEHHDERFHILEALTSGSLKAKYGFNVVVNDKQHAELVEDPTGDRLDALLCAVQAAWAWCNREILFGSSQIDRIEGWIADPQAVELFQMSKCCDRPRPETIEYSNWDHCADDRQADGQIALQDEFDKLREQAIWLRQTFNTFEVLFNSDPTTKHVLEESASLFFHDLSIIMHEYYFLLVCRLTGPAKSVGKDNLTIQRFTKLMDDNGCLTTEIKELNAQLIKYGEILKPARDKIIAHSDWETHTNLTALGQHTEEQTAQFFEDLQAYFDAAGIVIGVGPLDFRYTPGPGDAIDLMMCLQRASASERSGSCT